MKNIADLNQKIMGEVNKIYFDKISGIYFNSFECGVEKKGYLSAIMIDCESHEEYYASLSIEFMDNGKCKISKKFEYVFLPHLFNKKGFIYDTIATFDLNILEYETISK